MGGSGMPWQLARAVGDQGEDLVCSHLQRLGWELVARNWRCPAGEIDLVARDGDELVFCEVKTRRSGRFGDPVEAVGRAKARRLRRLAWAWLQATGERPDRWRIDVVGVLWRPGEPARLQHLRGVA
jgi:putative endonuclease